MRIRPSARSTMSCCSLRPSSPISWKPAVNTTAAFAETATASPMLAGTAVDGMLTSTRSTAFGISCSEANVLKPQISGDDRLIG